MKLSAEGSIEPSLNAVGLVLSNPFKEGVDEADDHKGGNQLWIESSMLSYSAGNIRRNSGSKRQQKKRVLAQNYFSASGRWCRKRN